MDKKLTIFKRLRKFAGLCAFFAFVFAAFCTAEVSAFENPFKTASSAKHIGKTADEAQIKKLVYDLNRASNKHDLEKIKTFYTPDFKNGDGFSSETFFKMIEETFKSYEDLKYRVKIDDIQTNGDSATANLVDKTSAKLKSSAESGDSYGTLEGFCNYIIYLKKQPDSEWKISGDKILKEDTSLKYGVAKTTKMSVTTPQSVEPSSEYSINLKMDAPKNSFVIASLNREDIVYPPVKIEEAFRRLPDDGELERIVRANSKGLGEYAVASIGFTRFEMAEDMLSMKIQMSGIAFLMNRVNVEAKPAKTLEQGGKI